MTSQEKIVYRWLRKALPVRTIKISKAFGRFHLGCFSRKWTEGLCNTCPALKECILYHQHLNRYEKERAVGGLVRAKIIPYVFNVEVDLSSLSRNGGWEMEEEK